MRRFIAADRTHTVWDNSIAPVLEVESGSTVELEVTDASGGQLMSESARPAGGLRRELRFWEAIALSIAIMAPTAAMALNGVAIAGLIGRAVPLAFLFALVGVLFVSYADRHLFITARRRPLWPLAFPVIGIAFLVFTIYENVAGTAAPYNRFPWIVLAWLAVGAAIVAVAPGVVRRIGVALTRELAEPDHRSTEATGAAPDRRNTCEGWKSLGGGASPLTGRQPWAQSPAAGPAALRVSSDVTPSGVGCRPSSPRSHRRRGRC